MKAAKFLIICVVFFTCKTEVKELPILSYKINNNGIKEHYAINYVGFKNQLAEDFTDKSIYDKVFVANFFFTRCPSICPPMRKQLIELSQRIDKDAFMIVSHTIDPEHDTPAVLKEYAEATGIPFEKWQFVRSTEANTKSLASQYMTNFKPNEDGTDFYHSSYAVLVDKNRMIRGFYNLLVPEDVERLEKDINSLLN